MANIFDNRPFDAKVTSIDVVKFAANIVGGQPKEKVNILPQVTEVNFYESIWDVTASATLVMYDPIGLLYNFPLVGEEAVIITVESRNRNGDIEIKKFGYVIAAFKNIVPSDKGKEVGYILELTSIMAFPNVTQKIQHAYVSDKEGNLGVDKIAQQIYDDYILSQMLVSLDVGTGYKWALEQIDNSPKHYQNLIAEPAIDQGTIVIPNMHAFDAIAWLKRFAVSEINRTNNNEYLFFENQEGFHFRSLQDLVKTTAGYIDDDTRPTQDNVAIEYARKNQFTYFADPQILQQKKTSQQQNKVAGDNDIFEKPILGVRFNNRITALEKIRRGYFQTQVVDINPFQKGVYFDTVVLDAYRSALVDDQNQKTDFYKMNTREYIDSVTFDVATLGQANRVIYRFNSGDDAETLQDTRRMLAKTVIDRAAHAQIDLHINIEGDFNWKAGDVIYCNFPQFQGFTPQSDTGNQDDFINGLFIVAEVRHTITGGQHGTVLRINKDRYVADIDAAEFLYGEETAV